jgi:hypothetical protein
MLPLATVAPATMGGRVAVLLLGAAMLILTLVGARRWYPPSFFRGFVVAVGIFLSFDIVVFHWLFRLHRITAGPEAEVIEPILVVVGVGFLSAGLRGESRSSAAHPARPRPTVSKRAERRHGDDQAAKALRHAATTRPEVGPASRLAVEAACAQAHSR